MDRQLLESAGAAYPQTHVQGLYAVPFGLVMCVVAMSNLEEPPGGAAVIALIGVLAAATVAGVALYYRQRFGTVTPTRDRQRRTVLGAAAGFAVFVAADQFGRSIAGPPPRDLVTVPAAWALGMLVFYLIAGDLKRHHFLVWGALAGAGLLPMWGDGDSQDATAYLGVGAALAVAGVIDHLILVRTFRAYDELHLESTDVSV
jgi:hypothetical protein